MSKFRPSHRAEDIAAGRAKVHAPGGASLSCERCGDDVGHHENIQPHLEDKHLPYVPRDSLHRVYQSPLEKVD